MSDNETSSRRAEANRRNAQKSTGPRTAEGKARSRFNAVKHGMSAATPSSPARTRPPSTTASSDGPGTWRPATTSSSSS